MKFSQHLFTLTMGLTFFLGLTGSSHAASGKTKVQQDVYKDVFASVSQSHLQELLKNLTGVTPVTVNGKTFSITDRYSPAAKANFREYWRSYFTSLGIPSTEFSYPTQHSNGESNGHNVEAVLPGKSADSVVIIVHYDSIGSPGNETGNPGVDDDMTGMAELMETARILTNYKGKLEHTVRFVVADYEEWAGPGLEGARVYAKYIADLAAKNNFKIVSAVDDEQSGWNCATDGLCGDQSKGDTFDVFSCSGGEFDYPAMGDALAAVATQYSSLKVNRNCIGQNSDHYAMWEIGVPTVVFSEHSPFNNPHFDSQGGDTYDKIDQDYFFKIAQVGVTFGAKLVGITP